MLTALPLPQAGTAPCREVSLEPTVPPEKRTPRGDTLLPHHCRSLLASPHSSLSAEKLQGNLQGLTTGNLIVMKKGEGACNNQHSDLDRPSSYM